MSKRRILLGALGAGLVVPQLLFAQAAKTPTVAVIFAGDSDDDEPALRSFFDQMEKLGLGVGQERRL